MPNLTGRVLSRRGSPGQMTRVFGQKCTSSTRTSVFVPVLSDKIGGRKISVNKLVAEPLVAVMTDVEDDGRGDLVVTFDGCYNCRKTRRSSVWSPHSWAVAVDINCCEQPDGSFGDLYFGENRGHPPRLRALAEYFAEWGFSWGGMWRRLDCMHFEATDTTLEVFKAKNGQDTNTPAVFVHGEPMYKEHVRWSDDRSKVMVSLEYFYNAVNKGSMDRSLGAPITGWKHVREAALGIGMNVIWDPDNWRVLVV